MKKKLRSQIKDLANEILSEEKSGNTRKMKEAAQRLYERLSVLEYLEGQIMGDGREESVEESLDSKSFREQRWFEEPEPVPQPEHGDELVEPLMEKIKDIVAQMPQESQQVDELLEEVLPKKHLMKNDLEEFASNYRKMPVFERKEVADFPKEEVKKESIAESHKENGNGKSKSLNDKFHKGLNIGLNDRLAFIKHLFDGKTEDYTRVLSQISSMQSFDEAQKFIKGKVKPDYDYWLKKDEYADRFMAIVEKSFH